MWGETILDCSSAAGEEAVGDSVPSPVCRRRCSTTAQSANQRGSSWGSCSFSVQAAGRKTLALLLCLFFLFLYFSWYVQWGFCLRGVSPPPPSTSVLLECTDSFRQEGEKKKMSFKSLKEFGVSAERLGSMCKRWMARVQRFVLCVWVTLTCMLRIFGVLKPLSYTFQFRFVLDSCFCFANLHLAAVLAMLGLVLVFSVCCTCLGKCLCARLSVDGDGGAAVLCTLVGIDYLSPRGSPERKMARFSISLISIIVLLHWRPRTVLDMLLAMQSRIHYSQLYIMLQHALAVHTC